MQLIPFSAVSGFQPSEVLKDKLQAKDQLYEMPKYKKARQFSLSGF